MSLDNCKLIDNSNFIDARGRLIVAQLGDQFHFPIKRQYVIQIVPLVMKEATKKFMAIFHMPFWFS